MADQVKIAPIVKTACVRFDDATYKTRTAYYHDKKRPELRDFIQYLYNCSERYIETGTKQHLDNAVRAGFGQGRLQVSVRILKTATAHAWNGGTHKFAGKMDKKRMEKLRADDGWKHNFKVQVQMELDRDIKQASTETPWDLDKAILTLVKKAESEKGGKHTDKQIHAALERALKAAAEAA